MSDEIRNAAAEGGENLSTADKLSSAAKALSNVDAETKARREEERLDRLMKEKQERELREELEKRRTEEDKQARELMRKKQAELEYAENYRKKLREQKARNEALAANRRAAERKVEEERQRKEAEEAAREEAIRQGLAEAEKRNAETDSLLMATSDRVKKKELAAEELKRRIREARDKAEKEAAEALLRSLEADDGMDGMIVTADGIELFPGNDGYDEALAKSRAHTDKKDADTPEEYKTEALRSEELLAAITARLANENADTSPREDGATDASGNAASNAESTYVPEISEDYILGNSISIGKDEKAEKPEITKKADDAEEDFVISLDTQSEGTDGADENNSTEYTDSDAPKKAVSETTEPNSGMYASGTNGEDTTAKNDISYLFSTSTYDMITADTDFGEDYAEKRRSNAEALQRYRDSEGAEAYSGPLAKDTDEAEDQKAKKGKKGKSNAPEYKYHAGGVYNSELIGDISTDGKSVTSAQKIEASKNEAGLDNTAAAEVEAASAEITSLTNSYNEEEERITKLIEHKAKLEGELHDAEEKNRAEIASLTEKEQSAKRDMLQTEFEIKEAQYLREIDELNARLSELERTHNAKREELQNAILHYETKSTELRQSADNDAKKREREALDKQSAEELNNASIEALGKNELTNYLNRTDSKERKLISRIDKARKQYKRAKNKGLDPAPSLYEVITLEGELIQSYIISYKHILSANSKKYAGTYKSKIKSLTAQLNKDLEDWSVLTGAATDTVSRTLADDIADGKELAAIPKVYLADAQAAAASKEGDGEKDSKGAKDSSDTKEESSEIESAANEIAGREYIESLSEKDLYDYLGKREKAERRLEKDIKDLKSKQKNAKNAKLLKYLQPCIEKEAELLESYLTDYKYIVSSTKQRDKKKYAAKVNTCIEAYNSDLEMWRGLTEVPITLYPTDAVKRIDSGEDVPKPTVVSTPDAPSGTKAPDKSTKNEELDELRGEAERTAEKSGLDAMGKRDLADYLNRSSGREAKLIRAKDNAEKKLRGKKGDAALVALKAVIDAKAELVDFYAEIYSATLAVEKTKYVRKYENKLTSAAESYNKSTKKWRLLADTEAYTIPKSIAKDIKSGKEYGKTPTVELADKYTATERVTDTKKKAEPKPKRNKEKPVITKADMSADLRTVEAKIDYRTERYGKSIELSEYRYGEQNKKDKRRLNNENSKLRAMKRGKRAVINAERSDNARYIEIANMDISSKNKAQSKNERLTELQERIRGLLLERKSINEKLDSLYAEEELGGKKSRGKSYRTKLSEYRLSEVKREFKRQGKNYRKVSKFRVSPARKQSAYDAMNKKIELTGYLAECQYRLKHEKPKAEARKYLKGEINKTKKSIKNSNSDINYYIVQNGKRSEKAPSPKRQMLWLVLLLLIVGACVALYIFRAPVLEWVKQTVSGLLPQANS